MKPKIGLFAFGVAVEATPGLIEGRYDPEAELWVGENSVNAGLTESVSVTKNDTVLDFTTVNQPDSHTIPDDFDDEDSDTC